ncbi:SPASM domain-containing protein [Planctomycetota bacterium]|nr:SPASM domain-containing protein [Planctomycetota bacterium]
MATLTTNIDRHLALITRKTQKLHESSKTSRLKSRMTGVIDFVCRGVYYVWRNHHYITFAKMANMGIANLEFKLKREKLLSRPYKLKIESTNICNTKCQLCPTGIGLQGRDKGKMSFENYKRLIKEIKWHTVDLDLSMWGDPLIVPNIYDMIRHAKDNGIWTYISSNLHAFKIEPKRGETEDQAMKLVKSGLELMTCSLHGATQETYEKYQPGKKLNTAIDKIKHIIRTRNAMGSSTPAVQLNFVVTRVNEHEVEDFKKLAEDLGCKAVISSASYNVRFMDQDNQLQQLGLADDILEKKTKEHLNNWMPRDTEYVIKPYLEMSNTGRMPSSEFNGKKPFDCSWPWQSSVINWDGQVVTCCGSFDPKDDMGNVFEHRFKNIWNNKSYRLARRSFRKELDSEEAGSNPCTNCPGYML